MNALDLAKLREKLALKAERANLYGRSHSPGAEDRRPRRHVPGEHQDGRKP